LEPKNNCPEAILPYPTGRGLFSDSSTSSAPLKLLLFPSTVDEANSELSLLPPVFF